MTENGDGVLEGTWDIIIDGDGVTNTTEVTRDKGIIYFAGPNPFSDELNIRYGVYRSALVSLYVFDINGNMVATLDEQRMVKGQYDAIWRPGTDLPAGHYFISLGVDDQQIDHKKVVLVK